MTEVTPQRENSMRRIRISKVTVNIGVGKSGEQLEKAKKVLQQISGQSPGSCNARKTIKDFGIRKGEPIGCKVTLRGEKAADFLKTSLVAVSNRLKETSFDRYGNFAFGIREHIEIPKTRYVPELGIFGMDVTVTLERPGYRVKRRSYHRSRVGISHTIEKDEAIEYVKQNFGAEIVEEEAA
jgi:large subunit ribosomal protein L5